MNYFELFEMPVSFKINKQLLPLKYFELQKKYHPDFYTMASDEEQSEVLELSSMVNKAFKTFSDEDETIRYVLQLKSILKENDKYDLPPDFLMEMMDLNEALLHEDTESLTSTEKAVKNVEEQIYAPVKTIIDNPNGTEVTDGDLNIIKDYYFKKKYLRRILDRIEDMRNIAPR
ncbi:co-chaperone HscB [soil metagenome]